MLLQQRTSVFTRHTMGATAQAGTYHRNGVRGAFVNVTRWHTGIISTRHNCMLFRHRLRSPLRCPRYVINIGFSILDRVISNRHLVVIFNGGTRRLTSVGLHVTQSTIFIYTQNFVSRGQFPTERTGSLRRRTGFVGNRLTGLLIQAIWFLLPTTRFGQTGLLYHR